MITLLGLIAPVTPKLLSYYEDLIHSVHVRSIILRTLCLEALRVSYHSMSCSTPCLVSLLVFYHSLVMLTHRNKMTLTTFGTYYCSFQSSKFNNYCHYSYCVRHTYTGRQSWFGCIIDHLAKRAPNNKSANKSA